MGFSIIEMSFARDEGSELCKKCAFIYIFIVVAFLQKLSRSSLLLRHYSSWMDHYEINKTMKKLATVSAMLPQSANL
jgi:hypothetical protein